MDTRDVAFTHLFIQWAIVAVVTGALIYTLRVHPQLLSRIKRTATALDSFKLPKDNVSDAHKDPSVPSQTCLTDFKKDSPTTPAREDFIPGKREEPGSHGALNSKYEVPIVEQNALPKKYRGIGRIAYFFGMLVLGFGYIILTADTGVGAWETFLILIVANALSFVLVVSRLHSIGMSGWWSLLILLPLANLFIGVKCLICPEGYQDTKKLDAAGKVLLGIILALSILALVGGMMSVLFPS